MLSRKVSWARMLLAGRLTGIISLAKMKHTMQEMRNDNYDMQNELVQTKNVAKNNQDLIQNNRNLISNLEKIELGSYKEHRDEVKVYHVASSDQKEHQNPKI